MIRMVSLPDDLPVTLEEVKAHTRIDAHDDDGLLMSYLHSSIMQVERAAGVAFSGSTWELFIDSFPSDVIEVGFGPITSVVSITYRDEVGIEQTLAAEGYTVDTVAENGAVYPVGGWPGTDGRPHAVRVTFTAGDGNVPTPIRNAIMMTTADAYENRTTGGELSGPAQRMVGMYRRVWF